MLAWYVLAALAIAVFLVAVLVLAVFVLVLSLSQVRGVQASIRNRSRQPAQICTDLVYVVAIIPKQAHPCQPKRHAKSLRDIYFYYYHRVMNHLDLAKRLQHWLQPRPTCELCQSESNGVLPLCAGCYTQLPWIKKGCTSCGEPITHSQSLCARCEQFPLPFTDVIIPLRYGFPVDQWVGALKYQERPGMAYWLAQLLASEINRRAHTRPTLVIGIPMHPQRQRQRGYNQSLLLAREVAKVQGHEFRSDLLRKTRATAHQRTLNAAARRLNLQNAFEVTEPVQGWRNVFARSLFAGKITSAESAASTGNASIGNAGATLEGHHIALVDDVVTTGATGAELANCLLNAGATGVSLWALAKTPMHTPNPSGRHVFLR